ncbi:hypothetical protein PEC18_06625 [Paucibacter sp. O1-1]|nr:hypothetical protein [Paucibacter sp. O1-1]MDA3825545.1 hypothetical protein [Paucibacter sp. O1-1]
MPRWLRALLIALLIPIYGLAAVGIVAPDDANAGQLRVEGHQNPEALGDSFSGNVADLAFELGDTSDDVSEIPAPASLLSVQAPAPIAVLGGADARRPTGSADTLLRPPRAGSRRA